MPSVSTETAQLDDYGMVEDRHAELDGYTVSFATFREDIDHRPILKGLPDDRCQCPHWGYVLKGRMTVSYGDREEVLQAGDAFYMPPGHVPLGNEPGSQLLMFSPTEELRETDRVIMKNVQAMQGQAS
jgi:glyoxylate utilization-related uncharacterized protein